MNLYEAAVDLGCGPVKAFFKVVLPEIMPMLGFDQRNPHHIYDVLEHSAVVTEHVPAEPVLRWAALLHDCGKPACFTVDDQGVGHFAGHPKAGAAIADAAVTPPPLMPLAVSVLPLVSRSSAIFASYTFM